MRDLLGNVIGAPRTIELAAGQQTARFVDELLSPIALNLRGSLEVVSDKPIDMVALRGVVNTRGEFLFTTTPLADYSAPLQTALLFAHFADGGGYSTQTIVLSTSATAGALAVRYFDAGGAPVQVDLK